MANVTFKKGAQAGLEAAVKAEGTLYVTTDEKRIYLDIDGENRIKIGEGQDTEIEAAKSAAQEAKTEAEKKLATLTAGDASVTVGGTDTAKTVAVAIDDTEGNNLKLVPEKGLRVEVPAAATYTIEKDEDSSEYAAVYHLKKNGVDEGVAINIPKDMVVKSGSVKEEKGTTYIVLVLNDTENTEIKVDVSKLIEYVTSGSAADDMVVVTVSEDHKVTAALTDGKVTLAKLEQDVQDKIGKAHEHENKDELDKITEGKVEAWDGIEEKLIGTAEGIEATTIKAGVKEAEDYADEKILEAMTWGTF